MIAKYNKSSLVHWQQFSGVYLGGVYNKYKIKIYLHRIFNKLIATHTHTQPRLLTNIISINYQVLYQVRLIKPFIYNTYIYIKN